MQNYVPGAIKQWKDLQDVIIWRVYVAKVFAICVVNLGNLIIKIILNVIYIKRKMIHILGAEYYLDAFGSPVY